MAHTLVLDTKFKPFSYDEMVKPVIASTQAQQQVEGAYTELLTKANVWEKMANEQKDKRAYKMYKKYADDLKDRAFALFNDGLNQATRANLFNMVSRYSKEITPIENAYNARAREIEEQYKGKQAGIVYAGDASQASIDRYLDDPAIKFGSANSQEGFKRVLTEATALTRKLRDYGSGKKLDPYTRTWLKQYGYEDTNIDQAIRDIEAAIRGEKNVKGQNILTSILDREMHTSGVDQWEDKNAKLDYFNRVSPALFAAVGPTEVNSYEDYGARLAAQEASQKRVARASQTPTNVTDGLPFDPINFTFSKTNRTNEIQDLSVLGINYNKKTNKYTIKKVWVPTGKKETVYSANPRLGGVSTGSTTDKLKEFNLYAKTKSGKQRMLTRHQFVSQGINASEKQELGKYYDTVVIPNMRKFNLQMNADGTVKGNASGQVYSPAFITKANDEINARNGAKVFQGVPIPVSNGADVYRDNIENIINRMPKQEIYEIKDENPDGSFKLGSPTKASKIKDKISTDGDNKAITYILSFAKGKEGLIMQVENKYYYLPAGNLGPAFKKAISYAQENQDVSQYQQAIKDNYYNSIKKESKNQGYMLTEEDLQGLVNSAVSQDPQYIKLSEATSSYGDAALRQAIQSLMGQYSIPNFNAIKN